MTTGKAQNGSANGCGWHGFDDQLGLRLARASMEAYSGPFEGKTVIRNGPLDLLATVEVEGNTVIVAFRGTVSLRNWRVDFEARRNALGVHEGIYNALQLLVPEIAAVLAQHPEKEKLFTGHSLGGGLAEEAWRRWGGRCVTFGQPRVLSASVARQSSSDGYWRVVDKEDIVPNLPGLMMGFRHYGNLLFFPCLGGAVVNPPWWQIIGSHVIGIYADLMRIGQGRIPDFVVVREHSMACYLNLMATLPSSVPQQQSQQGQL